LAEQTRAAQGAVRIGDVRQHRGAGARPLSGVASIRRCHSPPASEPAETATAEDAGVFSLIWRRICNRRGECTAAAEADLATPDASSLLRCFRRRSARGGVFFRGSTCAGATAQIVALRHDLLRCPKPILRTRSSMRICSACCRLVHRGFLVMRRIDWQDAQRSWRKSSPMKPCRNQGMGRSAAGSIRRNGAASPYSIPRWSTYR